MPNLSRCRPRFYDAFYYCFTSEWRDISSITRESSGIKLARLRRKMERIDALKKKKKIKKQNSLYIIGGIVEVFISDRKKQNINFLKYKLF